MKLLARNISSVIRYRLGVVFVKVPLLQPTISHSEGVSSSTTTTVSPLLEEATKMDSPQHDAASEVVFLCPAVDFFFFFIGSRSALYHSDSTSLALGGNQDEIVPA